MSDRLLEFGDHGEDRDELGPARGEDAPLTAEELAELKRRDAVEVALFNAEEVAEAQGFPELGKALARISLLWELGAEAHAVHILDKVRDQVLASLRAERPLDKEGEAGAE